MNRTAFLAAAMLLASCGEKGGETDAGVDAGERAGADGGESSDGGTEDSCLVDDVSLLGLGGDADWSHANDQIVFDRKDTSGNYQIYRMNADGSDERCLSCVSRSGAPRVDRHKGHPSWHPDGEWIVMQGEMDDHWGVQNNFRNLAEVGAGWWNDVYVASPDGERWYRLTTYSTQPSADGSIDGVLIPRFSADGSKLFWTKLSKKPDDADDWTDPNDSFANPFGHWRLLIADFVVTADGTPSLQNVKDITPSGGVFYEAQGFAPDGGSVVFTADIGYSPRGTYGMDIWLMDLATSGLSNLTDSPDEWDEHAHYSKGGLRISYMSSEPYSGTTKAFNVMNILSLRTELMIMAPDGSDKRQLTHFNGEGHPESTAERSLAAGSAWNANGSQIVVTQVLAGVSYPKRQMWRITFRGQCGG